MFQHCFNSNHSILILILLNFYSFNILHGQSIEQIEENISRYHQVSPKKAIHWLEIGRDKYELLKKWEDHTVCIIMIGENYFYDKNYQAAKEHLNKASSKIEKYKFQGSILESHTKNIYGLIAQEVGNVEIAKDYFKASLEIYKKLDVPYNTIVLYNNLALAYMDSGDYEQSLAIYRQTINKIEKTNIDEEYKITEKLRIYNDMGFSYNSLHQYKLADTYYQKALDKLLTIDKTKSNYSYLFLSLYTNSAINYQNQKNTDAALKLLQKALRLPNLENLDTANIYKQIGTTYDTIGNYKVALDYLQRSLKIRKAEIKDLQHFRLAETHHAIGNVYTKQKKYQLALESYQNALKTIAIKFHYDDFAKNPPLGDAISKVEFLKILISKAKVLRLKKDKKLALKTYEEAIACLRSMIIDYEAQASKLFLLQTSREIYEAAISLAIQLKDTDKAFLLTEKSKATLLLQGIRGNKAYSVLPKPLLQQEKDLKANIALYEKQVIDFTLKGENTKQIEATLFKYQEEYRLFKEQIKEDYPNYYQLKYDSKVTTKEQLQSNLLSNDKAIVEFYVGKKQIYVFVLTKKQLQHFIIPLNENEKLEKQIRTIQNFLKTPSDSLSQYNQVSYELYNTYLREALEGLPTSIKKLIIIPDAYFHYIPFETLLTLPMNLNSGKSKTFALAKASFLIQQYQINYSYSSTILMELLKKRKTKSLQDFGGFAPSFEKDNTNLQSCSGQDLAALSNEYLDDIFQIFDGDGLIYDGDSAKAERFRQEAEKYRILHLCTHACVYDTFDVSKIYFADTILYTTELFGLTLNADLAVLSACETGLGYLADGEGLMSLARAFIYSGCSSVITSLWTVNESSTSQLMTYFYNYLAKGYAKDEALHKAKLKYLDESLDGGYGPHPYYWSGFIHIGDTTPVFPSWWNKYKWWLISLSILLASILFWKRKELTGYLVKDKNDI